MNNSEWEVLNNYHITKIEKKEGIDAEIDVIRAILNKITDKNYEEMKTKILEILENINSQDNIENKEIVIKQMGENIFRIASTNRFYSKLYANLYSELINVYQPMKDIFELSFNKFIDLFTQIEYVDSAVNYDKFCKMNQDNEKRKALSCFFINLMINKVIDKRQIIQIIETLLIQLNTFIYEENKTNEVNEISENIVLLFNKEYFKSDDYTNVEINGLSILDYVSFIANSKSKNFKSLSTKAVFKFMDIADM